MLESSCSCFLESVSELLGAALLGDAAGDTVIDKEGGTNGTYSIRHLDRQKDHC